MGLPEAFTSAPRLSTRGKQSLLFLLEKIPLLKVHQHLLNRQAHFCVLASNCDEANYVKLIEALCAEHNINLLRVCVFWINRIIFFKAQTNKQRLIKFLQNSRWMTTRSWVSGQACAKLTKRESLDRWSDVAALSSR